MTFGTRCSKTLREIMLALRHFNRYELRQEHEAQLSRREASRRFKEKLVFLYRTPNRCC